MMEIEFRGKSINTGEWVYGTFYVEEVNVTDKNYMIAIPYSIERGCLRAVEVDPETVGQYTGLRDKKRTKEFPEGQKIYKGDIIEYDFSLDGKERKIGIVEWLGDEINPKYGWGIGGVNFLHELSNIKRIGNIYDNKDLLNGE